MIEIASCDDYPRIEQIWWDSVQATHQFIDSSYLLDIKQKLQSDYLPQIQLFVWRDEKEIQGFIGWSDSKIEMLFIGPEYSGRGIGKSLLTFAIGRGLRNVDVNEANSGALEFYKKQGFTITGRSEVDGAGMPYPIIKLGLNSRQLV